MEKYDYRNEITKNIKSWIADNTDFLEEKPEEDHDELSNWLYDELFIEDEITGNGTYFYDSEDNCSEYLSDNFDLVYEAMREFCVDDDINILIKQYENKSLARYFDCTIRCYLLGECIEKALEELEL